MAEVGNSYKDPLSQQQKDELRAIAQKILQPGKGILAADESTGLLHLHIFFVIFPIHSIHHIKAQLANASSRLTLRTTRKTAESTASCCSPHLTSDKISVV
jgi:hypothetical protein